VEYLNYLDKMVRNYARCTREIKTSNAVKKAAFNKKETLFTSKLKLNLSKKLLFDVQATVHRDKFL